MAGSTVNWTETWPRRPGSWPRSKPSNRRANAGHLVRWLECEFFVVRRYRYDTDAPTSWRFARFGNEIIWKILAAPSDHLLACDSRLNVAKLDTSGVVPHGACSHRKEGVGHRLDRRDRIRHRAGAGAGRRRRDRERTHAGARRRGGP